MIHTFVIDTESGILRESFVGVLDLNTLTEANAEIIADSRFKKGLNFLTDLREATVDVGFEEMFIHVSKLPDLGIKKQAFIVCSNLEYGMTRMFEMLTENKGVYEKMHIFREIEEGLEWLSP